MKKDKEVKNIEWAKNRIKNTLKFEALNDREIGFKVAMEEVLGIIDQLDEPEVLSKEWIDENRKYSSVHCIGYYVPIGRLHDLLVPKQEEVDRAYKDGYETGEEPKFYVLDKEGVPLLLRFSQGIMSVPSGISPIDEIVESQRVSIQFTEQEIKDYDEKYLVFKIPVEEVEDEIRYK